ncbi:MAG: hypothetical protein ABSG25_05720 [Bryobacteraceae bacterium]
MIFFYIIFGLWLILGVIAGVLFVKDYKTIEHKIKGWRELLLIIVVFVLCALLGGFSLYWGLKFILNWDI